MIIKKILWAITIAFTISGCANNYQIFYHDLTKGVDVTKYPGYVLSNTPPKLILGENPKKDITSMMEDGYAMLGYSSFISPNNDASSERKAIMKGEDVHAAVILLYSNYADTINKVVPLYSPSYMSGNVTDNYGNSATFSGSGGSMSYVPVPVSRNNYLATFWIKSKGILGLFVRDLSEDEHKQIKTNKGVSVIAVVKKSPAFYADIFKGDVILKMNGDNIFDRADFLTKLKDLTGRTIILDILRDGKSITKEVKTNSLK